MRYGAAAYDAARRVTTREHSSIVGLRTRMSRNGSIAGTSNSCPTMRGKEKMSLHELRQRFEAAGQGHAFRFFDSLSNAQREELLADLRLVDLNRLQALRAAIPAQQPQSAHCLAAQAPAAIAPAPVLALRSLNFPYAYHSDCAAARVAGEQLVRAGKLAVVLVAGGQGTRLGFDKPKGMLPIFPLSGRTLFDGFCAQVRVAASRFQRPIPLYIMTSDATHDETLAAFEAANWFGLPPADVRFFVQGANPALAPGGKLLLASRSRLALAPDGHGGCIRALAESGCLDDMRTRGCEWVSYVQVDNPFARLIDPVFAGLAAQRDCDAALKSVRKLAPDEKVGVFALVNGATSVVEYTELGPALSSSRASDGTLLYNTGNTAMHMFRRSFLETVAADDRALPLHAAFKAVLHIDETGAHVTPEKPNAWKFEQFIFDVLPRAKNAFALEVPRRREFLPVKSADGETSPASARELMQAEWRDTLRGMGIPLSDAQAVEIAPELWADNDALAAYVQNHRAALTNAAKTASPMLLSP